MTGAYRLYGAETSAYSTKLRSYLRYKRLEHEWRARTVETEEELAKVSRFPTIPVLVSPSGVAVHNTNPVMEALEADLKEPSATPSDPATAFLSLVLADFADNWLAKVVYHYRWTRKRDQRVAAQRVVEQFYPGDPPQDRKALEDASIVHMLGELKRIGIEGDLGPVLEKSFKRFLKLLIPHLKKHLYLFGGHPSIADFAIAAQLNQLLMDPTPAKLIEKEEEGAFVIEWCRFFEDPKPGGPFEPLGDLVDTLTPLFKDELCVAYLPWAAENIEGWYAHVDQFEVSIGRDAVSLTPMRSAATSFKDVRKRFLTAQTLPELKAFTDAVGATVYLQRPPKVSGGAGSPAPARSETAPDPAPKPANKPAPELAAEPDADVPEAEAVTKVDAVTEVDADAAAGTPVVEAVAVDGAEAVADLSDVGAEPADPAARTE